MRTVVLLVLLHSIAQAKHYKVYLIGGQSNATGRGDAAQLSTALQAAQTNVLFYYHKTLTGADNNTLAEDTWIDLAPGSGHGKNSPPATEGVIEFGPEVTFGHDLAAAFPSNNIAILKYSHGGSNLHTQWAATGDLYAVFLTTVEGGLAALTAAGHTFELSGMIWQQGEADTGASYASLYEANLTDLIARVRSDVFGGLNRPFVIGGLSSNQYADITNPATGEYTVRLAQETVAGNVDTAGFADADNCDTYDAYNIHLNGYGQATLGSVHAAKMIALEALDVDSDGLSADQEASLGTDPVNPDSDSDGQQDGIEFRAGTSPTDSNSYFRVTGIVALSNNVTLTWPSKSGNAYRVEFSTNLVDWSDVELDYPASGAGSNTVWTSADSGSEPSGTNILALYDAQTANNGDFITDAFDSVDTEISTTATRLAQGGSLSGGGSEAFVLANALFNTSASGSPGFNLADVNLVSRSAAATAGDSFSFTLQANGATVNYESISFYADQHASGAKVDVSYTVGGSETFVLQSYEPVGANASVALVEVDFANFSSTNDVVWTFYLYGAPGTANGTRFDDITLRGAATAPPSSVIALYDAETGINGDFNTTAFDSVDTETSTTATRLSQGGALHGGGQNKFILSHSIYDNTASGSHGFNLAGSTTAGQSAAATAGDWFSFTVEPNGNTVEYQKISFYTDQYGFGAKLDISYTIGTNETFIVQEYVMLEDNLPLEYDEVDFVDFSSNQNVVWTFYLYGASDNNYGSRFDDIALYGSSDAVGMTEEPASAFYRVHLQ
ncbi:sialate O-acetylesterase [Pontiellaceae bacterium B12227]|nr:sialate O-acetylesterase [Pontiellaceae bacterium B12227]